MNFLTKTLSSAALKLSVVTALTLSTTTAFAASSSGFIDGSSESTSALLEDPGFETQINRINVGINLVRLNTTILKSVPISEDSEWVDKLVAPVDFNVVTNMDEVKHDAYYSTAHFTNYILGRTALVMSPLNARLYWEASAIYKNSSLEDENGNAVYNADFHVPDMNTFPDIFEPKSFIEFKADEDVAVIDVTAEHGELYPNAVVAALSLVPESLHEDIIEAKKEFDNVQNQALDKDIEIAAIKKWLADPENEESSEVATKEEEISTKEAELETIKAEIDVKEEIFVNLVEAAAEAIANDFDPSKVKLAQKLQKLFDAVDNNAVGAGSMFTAATLGMYRGRGKIDDEIAAIELAQAYTTLVGNEKKFLTQRLTNMGMGTLYAIPNIAIGTYYATKQSFLIGKYQDIVDAVLDGEEAANEAKAAKEEAAKEEADKASKQKS